MYSKGEYEVEYYIYIVIIYIYRLQARSQDIFHKGVKFLWPFSIDEQKIKIWSVGYGSTLLEY